MDIGTIHVDRKSKLFDTLIFSIHLIHVVRYQDISPSLIWPKDWVGNGYVSPTQIVLGHCATMTDWHCFQNPAQCGSWALITDNARNMSSFGRLVTTSLNRGPRRVQSFIPWSKMVRCLDREPSNPPHSSIMIHSIDHNHRLTYSPFPTAFSCRSVVVENRIMKIPAHMAEQLSATWKNWGR